MIEAVIERLDIKQDLYAKLEAVKRDGTAVSSNTSTIPLANLVEGRSDAFKRDFLITHFFNPPRYMRLLEIVTAPADRCGAGRQGRCILPTSQWARRWSAPRIRPASSPTVSALTGSSLAVNAAFDLGVTVEEADAIAGKPMGVPKTGIFGLVDLVGIDLMPHLQASLTSTLPKDDPYHAIARDDAAGRKDDRGRLHRPQGQGRVLPLEQGNGPPQARRSTCDRGISRKRYPRVARPALRARATSRRSSKPRARPATMPGRCWAERWPMRPALVPAAASNCVAVDDAMKLGYNWKAGPFEMIDQLGAKYLAERLAAEGTAGARTAEVGRRQDLLPGRGRQAPVPGSGWRIPRCRAPRRRAAAGGHQAGQQAAAARTPRPRCGMSATALPALNSPAR